MSSITCWVVKGERERAGFQARPCRFRCLVVDVEGYAVAVGTPPLAGAGLDFHAQRLELGLQRLHIPRLNDHAIMVLVARPFLADGLLVGGEQVNDGVGVEPYRREAHLAGAPLLHPFHLQAQQFGIEPQRFLHVLDPQDDVVHLRDGYQGLGHQGSALLGLSCHFLTPYFG